MERAWPTPGLGRRLGVGDGLADAWALEMDWPTPGRWRWIGLADAEEKNVKRPVKGNPAFIVVIAGYKS